MWCCWNEVIIIAQSGYVITDGKNYIAKESYSSITTNIHRASFWKTETAAQNVLTSQKKAKANNFGQYNVKFVEVPDEDPAVTKHEKLHQTAVEIKDFLSFVLDDNLFAKEIVGLAFNPSFKCNQSQEINFEAFKTLIETLGNFNIDASQQCLCQELSKVDIEITDIEHKIELSEFNAAVGYKLAKELQQARRKRRAIKDVMTIMDNQDFINSISNLADIVVNLNKQLVNRTYQPRIRTDLFESN